MEGRRTLPTANQLHTESGSHKELLHGRTAVLATSLFSEIGDQRLDWAWSDTAEQKQAKSMAALSAKFLPIKSRR